MSLHPAVETSIRWSLGQLSIDQLVALNMLVNGGSGRDPKTLDFYEEIKPLFKGDGRLQFPEIADIIDAEAQKRVPGADVDEKDGDIMDEEAA